MTKDNENAEFRERTTMPRRQFLNTSAALAGSLLAPTLLKAKETSMSPKAFVYTEVAISVPFDKAPWKKINVDIKKQPGFLNKTWLQGHATQSLGGLYAFDSLQNATDFVIGYFPTEPRSFGVAHNTRVFDAEVVRAASEDMGSVHYSAAPAQKPAAFVYTELQISKPFEDFSWQGRNAELKAVPGLQNKLWLSGHGTHSLGGFDAFASLDEAIDYAINAFPETAAKLGTAFYTRVFDAAITEEASRAMNSPFYS